jgi:histidinol-phosphate aminotransferase
MSMRLHLNENTAGCSPAVMDVLTRLGRREAGIYPDYGEARRAVATLLGVGVDYVLLTNGLDEGILAVTGAAFRDRHGSVPEGLGVTPAFDMYETLVSAFGGRMVTVPMGDGFACPAGALREATGPATRIVFVTNPHNPSGVLADRSELLALARAIAPVLLFVDEAYIDFGGDTLVDERLLAATPNLVVGRTFSKAYGLAGLRVGTLVGRPDTLEPMRRIVPPYSLNAWVAAAVPAAVADLAYRDWYVAQAADSRRRLSAMCARLGLQTWPSRGNFILVRIGGRAGDVVAALALKGIQVRDRSTEPGCEGCIRITAGLVEDTDRVIPALEEAVCAAR